MNDTNVKQQKAQNLQYDATHCNDGLRILPLGEQVVWAIQLAVAARRAPRAEHTRTHWGNLSILPYLPLPARKA